MNRFRLLSITASIFLFTQSFAGTMGSVEIERPCWWVGTIVLGPVWANAGQTQTFYLTPEIEKSYVDQKSTNVLPFSELFIGVQKPLSYQLLGQLGLMVAGTGSARAEGQIWDDAFAEFNNHSYQYKVQNWRIAMKGKVLVDRGYTLMPWVSGSLGVGFNRAHNFTNTPLIFEAVPNANFTNQTKTAFTYSIGVGMQKILDEHWQLGVGYEFSDWGKSQLGRAPGQTLNSGLRLSHLYTNGVLFNLTYLTQG